MFLTYVIVDDVVTGGVDGSLPDRLTHHEEVVPLRQSHHIVHHSS